MKSDPANKLYYLWEKEKPVGGFINEPELAREELCYWLYWLREQAKEAKIWSGANDEIAYRQVRELIEKGWKE